MAYAKLDHEGRIEMWSYEHLDGFDVEFDNGEYVNETCVDGLEDFIIENGAAKYAPKPEKQTAYLKKELKEDDYIVSKFLRSLIKECYSMDDLLTILDNYREEYGDRIHKNHDKAARINDLEKQIVK